QHQQGVWYVPGGMHGIADGLQKLAEEIGVEFHTGQAVVHMEQDGRNQIIAVELADGTRRSADYYISNREVIPAYKDLLDETPSFIQQFDQFEPACSGLILHIGVNRLYPQLAHHNFFFSDDPYSHFNKVFHRHELPDDPTIYVVNVNKTDPGQALPGHENIKILPHIPYIQDQPFTAEAYLQLRERVLIKLERMGLTDLRQQIVVEDMWIPEDIRRMYGSHRGAIYGVVSDRKKNHGFKHPKHSTKYDNLYFVGGSVNPGGGMPMVTLSGQQVRDMIVQRDLLK
ncbi:MAG: NAD(P)/FAD-dependent oxidoreductase, partial [Firmicutes bacterium]|nr:NAD(P)/FAD-dependent oxidoreductase [Bacillota bacterium]